MLLDLALSHRQKLAQGLSTRMPRGKKAEGQKIDQVPAVMKNQEAEKVDWTSSPKGTSPATFCCSDM